MSYGFNTYDYGQQMQQMLNQQAQAQNQANHGLLGQTLGSTMSQKPQQGGGLMQGQGLVGGLLKSFTGGGGSPIGGVAGAGLNGIMKLFGGLFG